MVDIKISLNIELQGNTMYSKESSLKNDKPIPERHNKEFLKVEDGNGKVETLTINEGLVTVPNTLCQECSNLQTVNLPSTVTTIEVNAFASCFNLKTINFAGTKAKWDAVTKSSITTGSGRGRSTRTWKGYGTSAISGFKVICSDGQVVQY